MAFRPIYVLLPAVILIGSGSFAFAQDDEDDCNIENAVAAFMESLGVPAKVAPEPEVAPNAGAKPSRSRKKWTKLDANSAPLAVSVFGDGKTVPQPVVDALMALKPKDRRNVLIAFEAAQLTPAENLTLKKCFGMTLEAAAHGREIAKMGPKRRAHVIARLEQVYREAEYSEQPIPPEQLRMRYEAALREDVKTDFPAWKPKRKSKNKGDEQSNTVDKGTAPKHQRTIEEVMTELAQDPFQFKKEIEKYLASGKIPTKEVDPLKRELEVYEEQIESLTLAKKRFTKWNGDDAAIEKKLEHFLTKRAEFLLAVEAKSEGKEYPRERLEPEEAWGEFTAITLPYAMGHRNLAGLPSQMIAEVFTYLNDAGLHDVAEDSQLEMLKLAKEERLNVLREIVNIAAELRAKSKTDSQVVLLLKKKLQDAFHGILKGDKDADIIAHLDPERAHTHSASGSLLPTQSLEELAGILSADPAQFTPTAQEMMKKLSHADADSFRGELKFLSDRVRIMKYAREHFLRKTPSTDEGPQVNRAEERDSKMQAEFLLALNAKIEKREHKREYILGSDSFEQYAENGDSTKPLGSRHFMGAASEMAAEVEVFLGDAKISVDLPALEKLVKEDRRSILMDMVNLAARIQNSEETPGLQLRLVDGMRQVFKGIEAGQNDEKLHTFLQGLT